MNELCSRTNAALALAALMLVGCGSKSELVIGSDVAAAICATPVAPPSTSLIHRYSFDGTTTTVTDSVGMANGFSTVLADATHAGTPGSGPALDGSGMLTLDGVTNFVDLPNGLISSLTDVTVMMWSSWRSSGSYERVFDFGTSTAGEGVRSACKSCLLVMVGFNDPDHGLCAQVHAPGYDTEQITTIQPPDTNEHQVTLTFKANDSMTLYLDGVPLGSTPVTIPLSAIMDDNDWLGLSEYMSDRLYQGSLDEFRIYDRALSACEVAATVDTGPDQL